MNVHALTFGFGPREVTRKTTVITLCSLVLILIGLLVRYPGSTPKGWQRATGTVSGTVAKGDGTSKRYYPVVQYLALGYSHEVNAKRGYSYAPDFGTPVTVAFDAGSPEDAVLLSDTSPNYFRLLPWLGVALPSVIYVLPRATKWYSAKVLKAHAAQQSRSDPPAKKVAESIQEKPVEEVATQPEETTNLVATQEPELSEVASAPAFIGPRESLASKSKHTA